jgi:hypothetical protein
MLQQNLTSSMEPVDSLTRIPGNYAWESHGTKADAQLWNDSPNKAKESSRVPYELLDSPYVSPITNYPWEVNVKSRFEELLKEWKKSVGITSEIEKIIVNPYYFQIIGLGPKAVPLLLKELQKEPGFLYIALASITEQNPVPDEIEGDVQATSDAWLNWGKQNGILLT